MTIHKLKLNAAYYDDSASGIKTFEIRKNDRDFKVGDILELREWVWSGFDGKGTYTGNVHWKVITYILDDEEYLYEGFVCLAVSPIAEPQDNIKLQAQLAERDRTIERLREAIASVHKSLDFADSQRQSCKNYTELAINNGLALGRIAVTLKHDFKEPLPAAPAETEGKEI